MALREDRAPVWAIWLLIAFGAVQPFVWMLVAGMPARPIVLVPLLIAWVLLLVIAAMATRRITWLWRTLTREEQAHKATLSEVTQLQTQNAILEIVARSVDVPLAFQALSDRISGLVPCDRTGLALLSEDGQEFQTYTARVQGQERRARPRPEIVFKVERTIIGTVVRTREPLVIDDMELAAPDYLDANVIVSAGFLSGLILPLLTNGRAVGTLNAVSRRKAAFRREDAEALQSIAEILAVAWTAQQLQMRIGRYRTMEAMSDLTLSISAEINSALQTIVGHCDLLERGYPGPALQRDLATVVRQAQRIADLLEKMRTAANERLREATHSMHQKQGL